MKSTTKKATSKTASSTSKSGMGSTNASSQGARKDGVSIQGKTSKEAYLKKLAICSKVYDYKDEKKDEKAKQDRLDVIADLQ